MDNVPSEQQPIPANMSLEPPRIDKEAIKQFAKETWTGFSPLEKYILWVFFGLGGLFVVLMLAATVANLVG